MAKKNNIHNSRNLDDFLGDKGELLETNTHGAPVKDIKWEAQQISTTSDPIKDPGEGRPVLLRTFEYSLNPNLPKDLSITKQAIFDSHKDQIRIMLWSDGLIPLEEIKKPKVQISKSQKKYRIFVLCIPKSSETLLDKPLTIS